MTFSPTVGNTARLLSNEYRVYGVQYGDLVHVCRVTDYNEAVVRTNDEAQRTFYTSPQWLIDADLALVNDLDTYKKIVARVLWTHKKINGWCGVVEELSRRFGLAAYLPAVRTVKVESTVALTSWPDEDEQDWSLTSRARSIIEGNDAQRHASGDTFTITEAEVQDGTSESACGVPGCCEPDEVEDESPTDESVGDFRERLARVARQGEREHGVNGVSDFLRAVGIDPDAVPRTRRVGVEMFFDVPVGESESADEVGEACVTLMLASAGAEGVSVNRVWEDSED